MDDIYNKIKEKAEAIHEGIQNLKKRTDFENLMHEDRLWEVESAIDEFRDHDNIDGLRHALSIFRETAGLHPEGANAFNVTIWDANVRVRGKMATLDELFSELEKLVTQYIKEG